MGGKFGAPNALANKGLSKSDLKPGDEVHIRGYRSKNGEAYGYSVYVTLADGRTGEFTSENVHITERYIFAADGQRYNYQATFTDPDVTTRPWTATIPARRRTEKDATDGWHYEVAINQAGGKPVTERYERICTENNIGFGNVALTPGK